MRLSWWICVTTGPRDLRTGPWVTKCRPWALTVRGAHGKSLPAFGFATNLKLLGKIKSVFKKKKKNGQCGPDLRAYFPMLSMQTRGLPSLEKGGAAGGGEGGLWIQGALGGVGRP